VTTSFFKQEGDIIVLLGELGDEMGGSHYLKVLHGRKEGVPPRVDYERERSLHDTLRALIRMGLVKSAHDCSEGGLAVALAESAIGGGKPLGASIDFGTTGLQPEVLLFNESQSRVVITTSRTNAAAVEAMARWRGTPARIIGVVGGRDLRLTADGKTWQWEVAFLHDQWYHSIARCMTGGPGGR